MVSCREFYLHFTIVSSYDGYCEVLHGVPVVAAFNLELLLDVDVVLLWNYNKRLQKEFSVFVGVHASESYPFAFQKIIERLTPRLRPAKIVEEYVFWH